MTTFKSSLHKRQTTKTKEGIWLPWSMGSGETTGFGGKMEDLQKSAVIPWNSMNIRTTSVLHSLSGQARFRDEAASFERERANQVWGGHTCNPSTWWG